MEVFSPWAGRAANALPLPRDSMYPRATRSFLASRRVILLIPRSRVISSSEGSFSPCRIFPFLMRPMTCSATCTGMLGAFAMGDITFVFFLMGWMGMVIEVL